MRYRASDRLDYLDGFFALFFFGVKGAGGVLSIRRMVSSARLRVAASIFGRSISGFFGSVFMRGV